MSNVEVANSGGKVAPKINLHKPDLTLWGPLETESFEQPSPELLAECKAYYDAMLIPELVCAPGNGPDRPHESWIASEGKTLITVRGRTGKHKGELLGCWILKEAGIYYPVINIMKGAEGALPLLRALAYKSFELVGEDMHASTENPLIQAWVNHATDTPEEGRPDNMPLPKFQNGRVEWKS